jgi:hypothetical protein
MLISPDRLIAAGHLTVDDLADDALDQRIAERLRDLTEIYQRLA